MNRDTVIGIVGAVILVAAMVGVFQYERTRAPTTGTGDFTLTNSTLEGVSGETTIRGATEEMVNVSQQNVTTVLFTLKWSPSTQGFEDTLKLTVIPPGNGTEATASGASGTLELPVNVTSMMPTPGNPVLTGTGAWTIKVEYLSTTSPTGPLPLPQAGTVSWTLAGTVTSYQSAAS